MSYAACTLIYGTEFLVRHLELLYQKIFNCGVVPAGVITPVPKKGKNKSSCSSYRPITVSPILCKLFELLVIDDINQACSTPDHQFGFKKGYSREHVHTIIANVLVEIEESGETVIMAGHDVSRAFDSGIHPQLLLSAEARGLNRSIVRVYRDMYSKLYFVVKLPFLMAMCCLGSV